MSYDLQAHAASGNRFAQILYAALLYRQEIARRIAEAELNRLRKRSAWKTPDGPRRDDEEDQGAGQEGRGAQDQAQGSAGRGG